MSESTRSYDHSPDRMFGTGIPVHTRDTVEMGTVLHRFGKLKPIPAPVHTRGHIITGLPVPVSCLIPNLVDGMDFNSA